MSLQTLRRFNKFQTYKIINFNGYSQSRKKLNVPKMEVNIVKIVTPTSPDLILFWDTVEFFLFHFCHRLNICGIRVDTFIAEKCLKTSMNEIYVHLSRGLRPIDTLSKRRLKLVRIKWNPTNRISLTRIQLLLRL